MNAKIHACFYVILVATVLVLSGLYIYTSRTAEQLDSEARELREDLTRISRTSEQIQNNYISVTTENARLRQEILNGFSDAYNGISDIEQGLADIGSGIDGVLSEMRAYAEEAQDPH